MSWHVPDNAADDSGADDADDGNSEDVGSTDDTASVGGEQVELYPAPTSLVEHEAFEKMFSYDYDEDFDAQLDGIDQAQDTTDETEVTAKCVVSARLRLARFRTIEFLELSKTTDDIAALYPDTVWIKMRGIYGMHLIVMVVLWILAFACGCVVAVHVTQLWHMAIVAAIVVVFMRLSQRVMMGQLIKESPWYSLSYQSWRDLVKCMEIWDNQGVTHSDIYSRVRVFFNDVARDDEHDFKVK